MTSTLPDWAQEHMRNYLATDGVDGHIWRGVPTLLLTTVGCKSGASRMLPLIYGQDGDDYIIVASKGGFPEHPAWYNNLVAQPEVQVRLLPINLRPGPPPSVANVGRSSGTSWQRFGHRISTTSKKQIVTYPW